MVFGLAVFLASSTARPQTPPPSEAPGPCLIVSEIEVAEVLSNKLVVLRMRDGGRVQLHLENSCPQLKFHGRFAYRTQGGQLCVGRDMLISRSGEPCRITDIETTEGAG